jgi:predicted RNA-binding Zn-ribbon protein involved in translation (DUF1610 family)
MLLAAEVTEPEEVITDVPCPMCGGTMRLVRVQPNEGAVLRCEACGYARALTEAPPPSRKR